MKLNLALLLIIAALLSACAPTQPEPIVAPPASENIENETALQPVDATTPTLAPILNSENTEEEPMSESENDNLQEMPAPLELPPAEDTSGAGETVTMTVKPAGEVNMSDLANEPTPPVTPRVMPKPGVPNQNQPPAPLADIFPQILADLATRVGTENPSAQLTTVNEVTWNDGSVGCPQDGMMYTMALVDGYRLTFVVDGVEYAYHTDNGRFFTYCENKDWQSKTTTSSGFGSDK